MCRTAAASAAAIPGSAPPVDWPAQLRDLWRNRRKKGRAHKHSEAAVGEGPNMRTALGLVSLWPGRSRVALYLIP